MNEPEIVQCPHCKGDGWVLDTIEGNDGEPEPIQEIKEKCQITEI